ncbi:MAG: hypothetical protein V1859_05710 [archaeon]
MEKIDKKIYSFLKNKCNFYIFFAIYLLVLLLVLSINFLNPIYKRDLPLYFSLEPTQNANEFIDNSIIIVTNRCYSNNHFINYVKNDIVTCFVNVNYTSNSSLILDSINVKKIENGTTTIENKKLPVNENNTIIYEIHLDDASYQTYFIDVWVYEKSSSKYYMAYEWSVQSRVFDYEHYVDLQNQKIPTFLAILSAIIFSVFSAVSNLKDLIEGKRK